MLADDEKFKLPQKNAETRDADRPTDCV